VAAFDATSDCDRADVISVSRKCAITHAMWYYRRLHYTSIAALRSLCLLRASSFLL